MPVAFPDPAVDLAGLKGEQAIVLAGGCFWCVEAVYRQLDGVLSVVSGYAGGTAATANYRAVCSGATDHAEAVRIVFDSSSISLGKILKVFLSVAHDPTERNRQGADVGRQYRSAIFWAGEDQRRVAEAYIRQIDETRLFSRPVATTVERLDAFYEAEDYHQDYAALHPEQPYIACVALPKVEKLRQYFPELLARASR